MSKIQIVVPVFNRKKITELCLKSLMAYKTDNSDLIVYNDHSTDYDNDFLKPLCDKVIKLPKSLGVQHLRWYQFREFLKTDYDFLYFTDNDTIHDKDFLSVAIDTYKKYMTKDGKKMPVCLYSTIHHTQTRNQLAELKDVYIRRYTPGVSNLYDREMVEIIVKGLDNAGSDPDYAWDYRALEYLARPTLTTKISYLEHFGANGLHTKGEDYDRDRAMNPTSYLSSIREDVISYLKGKTDNVDIFSQN